MKILQLHPYPQPIYRFYIPRNHSLKFHEIKPLIISSNLIVTISWINACRLYTNIKYHIKTHLFSFLKAVLWSITFPDGSYQGAMFLIRTNSVLFCFCWSYKKSICKQQHAENAAKKYWKRCFFAPKHGEGVVKRVITSYLYMSFCLYFVFSFWRPLILHALIFVIKILRTLFFTLVDSWKPKIWVAFYQGFYLKCVHIFLMVLNALSE